MLFCVVHLAFMMVRAELNDMSADRTAADLLASAQRRVGFTLFGAFLGYLLYRSLRRLRWREFERQALIGAALALGVACVQAAGNALIFRNEQVSLASSFLYALLYWFWFYFSWATAYLALSYSITVQEQERRAAELAVAAQEAQVRALRYQINPHFLFNTLNAIAALVRDAPARAEEMIVQLSDFFRRSLSVNPIDDVTLEQEVSLQQLYLDIERTRFPDRLRVETVLDADAAQACVPALLLQPLVENAVKHGVARSEGPTRLEIRGRLNGAMLEVLVENDAIGSGPAAGGEGVGLRNVAERLRARFGDGASLSAQPRAEGGFRNVIRMPLRRC